MNIVDVEIAGSHEEAETQKFEGAEIGLYKQFLQETAATRVSFVKSDIECSGVNLELE